MSAPRVDSTDVLVVGGGPAGAAAALHAARRGLSVLLVDAARFPRDKTCGDGLTPRAMHQLQLLGFGPEIAAGYRSRGLKLHGFGGDVTAPWPKSAFGSEGSAMRRTRLDALLFETARATDGVTVREGSPAVDVSLRHGRVESVTVSTPDGDRTVRCGTVIVADGVRSPFGKLLGRVWHRTEVYGIAARAYCATPFSGEEWIHSHLELRDREGRAQPGYGWIFPLGDGHVNIGCGALSTTARPAKVNTKKLLSHYAGLRRAEWSLGPETDVASALLPMGGAVSGVAGPNWMLIGDAAACVNPLNGEGIDYGLETARLAAELIDPRRDLTVVWPRVLRENYGEAFLLARTAARLLTHPRLLPAVGPFGFRGPQAAPLMRTTARLMGNLVTDGDRDVVARAWRTAAGGLYRLRGSGAVLWA
ncbi:geranylgeranyl reductase family protein [Corynebacterium sp. P7202]|uniref:Geranylgeranyl reductase family protein n=1 Tax=Corynebacterium pygosceleis TaxID=2800406 RepID=A0A9Q4GKG9_9CORY|nr:geranylgeranyl reductase family protein [Corynebacterium pygosceleis]MCK7637469.1 geranylgeranyl reductase family protein [Corynebacterium pygosceleis]MCX7445002.1 geranylgeranyl reductase family protein [Corynebacterium pygosceleis]MCX7468202.1 geranylgeranyl reductase family protein [Corynebacterium pygosceleis]